MENENAFWIEWEDGGARWSNASEDSQEKILAYAESLLGAPDTLA